MAKFVIEGAQLSCQYGTKSCGLTTLEDRHITTGLGKGLGNEVDETLCQNAFFGICRSPYNEENNALLLHEVFSGGVQQISVLENMEIEGLEAVACDFCPAFLWQGVNPHVQIAKQKALMEDSWTICKKGLGIISVITSGQEGTDIIKEMQEKLKELEHIIEQYMAENEISAKEKNSLMESVLLWNGYTGIPWNYESSKTNRDFCSWLEKEKPALFNYFERGLYVGGGKNKIDLTYMLGLYKTIEEKRVYPVEDYITVEMAEDMGMFNGYMEAVQIEQGKNINEALSDFLSYYSSPDYKEQNRYESYLSRISQETRDYFCRDNHIDASQVDEQEINLRVFEQTFSDPTSSYQVEATEAFMKQLRAVLGRDVEENY